MIDMIYNWKRKFPILIYHFIYRFETNIECYTVDVGDTVMLHTDISGYPQPHVEWYFGEQKLEQSE